MTSSSTPTAVKVFGILHILFGTFGVVTSLAALAILPQIMEFYRATNLNPLSMTWLQLSSYLSPVLAAIMVAVGIGLLMKKPWGLSGAIIYAFVSIAFTVIGAVFTVMVVSSITATSPEASAASQVGGLVGGLIGTLLSLIYPVLTLVFLNKPSVKEAIARHAS